MVANKAASLAAWVPKKLPLVTLRAAIAIPDDSSSIIRAEVVPWEILVESKNDPLFNKKSVLNSEITLRLLLVLTPVSISPTTIVPSGTMAGASGSVVSGRCGVGRCSYRWCRVSYLSVGSAIEN